LVVRKLILIAASFLCSELVLSLQPPREQDVFLEKPYLQIGDAPGLSGADTMMVLWETGQKLTTRNGGRTLCRVSLIPPGGQTINGWINRAAFSVPVNNTWGNAGADIVRGPGLFQIDTALSKRINLTERTNLMLRMEAFNVFNHPQLGNPNVNFSSPLFGQITSISNTTPSGTGTARSVQVAARFTF
jgi:hypothetical protein